MDLGIPCSLVTSLKYNFAIYVASFVLLHGMKCAIFENLSPTIRIESLFLWILGEPKMKSMFTSTQGKVGTAKGVVSHGVRCDS